MRITNRNQIMSQLRNMNTTLNNLTNSNNRMSSQRKFNHAYEDVASATKAMRLRKSIRDKDFYLNNIRDARGRINSAEDALQTSVDILRTVTDRVEQALNGTYAEDDRMKIATEIGNLQEEVLSLMNSSYTDHFVFDAAGGAVKGEQPFKEMLVDVPKFVTKEVPVMAEPVITQETVNIQEPTVPLYDKHGNQIEEGIPGETYYLHYYGEQTGEMCEQEIRVGDVAEDGFPYFAPGTKQVDVVHQRYQYQVGEGQTVYKADGTLAGEGEKFTIDDGPFYSADPTAPGANLANIQIAPGTDSQFEQVMRTEKVQETREKLDANGNKIPLVDEQGRQVLDEKNRPVWEMEGVMEQRKTLTYHGMPVDELQFNKETGKVEWYQFDENGIVQKDPATGKLLYGEIPYNEQNYIDIGLGHKLVNTKDGQKINPETVFQFTLSGAEVFGLGTTDGMSNNMYSLMGEIVESLEANDMETLGSQFDHLKNVRATLLTNLTEIGVRTNFLDDMENIHKNDKLNFQTRQTDIEAVDLAEEAMYNKNHEMAWMVTLQLGSKDRKSVV